MIHSTIVSYIDEIILSKSKWDQDTLCLSYDALSDNEKNTLTALMIEEDDGDLFSVYENDRYADILGTFLRYLKNPNLYTRNEFTDILRLSVVDYYKKRLTVLINEKLEERQKNSIGA